MKDGEAFMAFRDILEYCRIKAMADLLFSTEESVWRDACRNYSESFHTPLLEVMKLDPEHVLLNNFERQLKDIELEENIENILEQFYKIENPNYDQEVEEELQRFIRKVEESDKKVKKSEKKEVKEMPKSGSVDFSHIKDDK